MGKSRFVFDLGYVIIRLFGTCSAPGFQLRLDGARILAAVKVIDFAYATTQPLNDLVGLKTPDNIDIHRRHTARGATILPPQTLPTDDAGWGESTERIAIRSGARILVVSDG